MTDAQAIRRSTCARHIDRHAVGRCGDCARPLCGRCVVEIPAIGTFCWACASRRGGLSARRPAAFEEEDVHGVDHSAAATVGRESDLAVLRFEQMLGDRQPRPLISGLTERLEEAGADPEDVVDDEELLEDIARLQDQAGGPAPPHPWWLRRR